MDDDRPYEIVADGKPTGIVELQVDGSSTTSRTTARPARPPRNFRVGDNDVVRGLQGEFDKAYKQGRWFC